MGLHFSVFSVGGSAVSPMTIIEIATHPGEAESSLW
jgi:hypothetical protein